MNIDEYLPKTIGNNVILQRWRGSGASWVGPDSNRIFIMDDVKEVHLNVKVAGPGMYTQFYTAYELDGPWVAIGPVFMGAVLVEKALVFYRDPMYLEPGGNVLARYLGFCISGGNAISIRAQLVKY